MKKLTIGNVELPNQVILAPMAGVSDIAFRLLCHEQGAGLVCSEMVSVKAILYGNKNTEELLQIHPEEGAVSLQLFGSDPDIVSEMAKRIEERPFAVLDLNMGCPVPKVVNNGEGSALMKDPLLAGRIVEKTAKAIQKPLTVKIRKGFDDDHVNAVEMAHILQESGAAAVAVHGRTREQYYSGQADWDIIAQVKAAVKIPVIGNGDVTDGESALRLTKKNGLRRRDDRQGRAGKSVGFSGGYSGAGRKGNPAAPHEAGALRYDRAPCAACGAVQRGIYHGARDAQASGMVYDGASPCGGAAQADQQHRNDGRAAGGNAPAAFGGMNQPASA